MPDSDPLKVLLNCLHSHDIVLDHRELGSEINTDQKLAMEKWIDDHVAPDTLLTKEELSLYLALKNSGGHVALAESQDLSLVKGVDDRDIRSAIDELKRSTTLVEKESETLRIQQAAMASATKRNQQLLTVRTAINGAQSRTWTSDNTKAGSVVDERIQSLKYQVTELETRCKAADVGLRKAAVESLRRDDKLLSGLQDLADNAETALNVDDNAAQKIRDLCTRLIKFTVEAVRARLDRVYIETTGSTLCVTGEAPFTKNSEVMVLLEELESLYAEILPVAQMSAEQQYLAPALRLISSIEGTGRARAIKTIRYVSYCLSEIISRLEELNTHAQSYESYRKVTTTLGTTIKSEINRSNSTSPKAKADSPSRVRKLNKPISPIRPRITRRRSSATSFDDEINPEQQLFRNLGLSLHQESDDEFVIIDTLKDLLEDRAAKLNGHTKALREVSESSIASHLYDSQVTLQLVMESLLSETPYMGMNLIPQEIKEGMRSLRESVEEVRRNISAVDLERLRERSVSKDELVERWIR